jgi:tetratricopeptide (TPR) repeat protein
LARCRDTQQLFEEALFLRRCAATLTPDSEDYARAYFDTCRILKRSKEGLEFLRGRTRQHGHKQAGPWITLATALDSIRSSREAVTVLEEARTALPDNGELLLGAGALMAGWGGELRERGMRWVEAARGKVPDSDWLRHSARLAGFLGDRPLAILRWRTLLTAEPLATEAWRALTRLVAEEEGEQVALELLKGALTKYPAQTALWALLAEMRSGHPEEAIPALDRMLELDPHDRWAWRERALRRLDKGQKEEAVTDARQALVLDPKDAFSHGILASILQQCGKKEEARAGYETALRLDIDYVFAARGLAGLATEREESLRAVRFIESEMRRQVSNGDVVPIYQELAWRFVDPPVLLGHLQEFCHERPDLWQTWMARVRQALLMRLDVEALAAATTLTESFPLLPRAWMVLAEVHRASGRIEDEERALAQAVDLSPGWDEAGRDYADVLERMGRLADAEALLRRALLLEPLVPQNYGVLADFLNRTNRRKEAAELLRKAVDISPFYSWGWETRARWAREDRETEAVALDLSKGGERHGHRSAWWSMAAETWVILGENEESLAAVRRGLALTPTDIALRDQLAHRHALAGRFAEALSACGPVAGEEAAPTSMEGRRAWILMQSGQAVKAIETMQALLQRAPDYAWGMSELARWLSQRHDWEKLRELTKNWTRLEPGELPAWGYLGQAERALGNAEAAKEAYRRAHSMHPDYVFAGRQLADIQMELRDFDGAQATLRLLRHYAASPVVTGDAIELELRRGNLPAALAEAEKLPGDPDVDAGLFQWCSDLFRKEGHVTAWQKWLASKVESGPVASPGALVAYLSGLPEKRQLKEAVRWISREAEGSPARIAAWMWAIDKAGKPGNVDTLRRWAVAHRKEFQANRDLWNAIGSSMAEAGLGDLGIQWFAGWKERLQDMNAAGLVDLALMYEQVKRDHQRNWYLAAEARREMLARFPAHPVGPMARASLAFHCAVEGELDQAAGLLADFEPGFTNEYYQQMAHFAEAILDSAAGRNSEAEEKARRVLGYIAEYPVDESLQRHRARGERALVSHQAWAKGSIRRLRKKWHLPAARKQGLLEGGDKGVILWLVLFLLYVAIKACKA